MKLSSFTIAAAVAVVSPTTVSAAECTLEESEAFEGFPNVELACPTLFKEVTGIVPTDYTTITAKGLLAMSPCQESTCLTELTDFVGATSDCFYNGFSVHRVYRAFLEICEAFSVGDVTVSMVEEIFTAADISGKGGSGDNGDQTGGEADSTTTTEEPETETPETAKPETKVPETKAPATAETPVATTRDPSLAVTTSPPTPTTAPTPVPTSTPTSHATATTIVGVSVVTTATLVASLLL